jgi:putative transposase
LPASERLKLVEPNNELISVRRQCALLQVNRSSLYYQKQDVSLLDLNLMDKIDKIYIKKPYYGSRKITKALKRAGVNINRKHTQRLMRLIGIEAVYPKKRPFSNNQKTHHLFPYLLKDLKIKSSNQAWAIDITYIRLNQGFIYLTAVIDWFSRFVVGWELSNSLETDFCLEAIKQGLDNYAKPQIINSDQGTQFTSNRYINFLNQKEIQISMDHQGRCFDNIFVERLWRSVKYEEVYLHSYQNILEAKHSLKEYFYQYNFERLHESNNYQTPAEIYFKS